ncbi:MAG: ABC transporter ATP-binding protein [Clostridia bacterium]|nr:ABC transporter ATP-binding protein [Clostridia bacterium]
MNSCHLTNISYKYPDRPKSALTNVNLAVKQGSFTLISGVSGSGKSTLGKIIKGIIPKLYGGVMTGSIETDHFGYVLQDPEKQMLMTTVEREIAFGMENLGLPYNTMRKRVAEILDYIGLSHLRTQNTKSLSGGQQQKLAIGCAIAMGYSGLILDEPTGQLDPVSSSEILSLLKRLNEEQGMTIILIEQKLDAVLEAVDRVIYLTEGKVTFEGTAKDFVSTSHEEVEEVLSAFTIAFRQAYQNRILNNVPLSVKEARRSLRNFIMSTKPTEPFSQNSDPAGKDTKETVLSLQNIIFSYNQKDRHLSVERLCLKKGEILGVIGENGSGKSTLLKIMSGVLEPQKGEVLKPNHVGFLSQNPNDYFFEPTLGMEIKQVMTLHKKTWDDTYGKIIDTLALHTLLDCNPRDLSGGERQRAAIAIVLASAPNVLLLDEPTRGLNKGLKRQLIGLLKSLREQGICLTVISHDMEFMADLTDRIAIISGGVLQVVDRTQNLLSDGLFYVSDFGKLFAPYGLSVVSSKAAQHILLNLKERA